MSVQASMYSGQMLASALLRDDRDGVPGSLVGCCVPVPVWLLEDTIYVLIELRAYPKTPIRGHGASDSASIQE